jgi:hypothetical protein
MSLARCAAGLCAALAGASVTAFAAAPPSIADPVARAALEALAPHVRAPAGAALEYEANPGPLGVTILRARFPHAYPGDGVASVVLFDGVTWGIHGQRTFADLVRKRGWRAKPPRPGDLLRIVDAACFEGMGSLHSVVVKHGKRLRIEALRVTMPVGDLPVVVDVGPEGPERIGRE